jgi:ABC-type sugar transport system substrate-binding protein
LITESFTPRKGDLLSAVFLVLAAVVRVQWQTLPDSVISSKGPNGQVAQPASAVTLNADELSRIGAIHAKAAIVLHYGGNAWSNAQVDGLKTQFARMGIEVIAVTDAGFKPEKQVSDIEAVLARKTGRRPRR